MPDILLTAAAAQRRCLCRFGDVIQTGDAAGAGSMRVPAALRRPGQPGCVAGQRSTDDQHLQGESPRAAPGSQVLERHPLSSQCFLSTGWSALPGDSGARRATQPIAGRIRAFLSSGHQGVNYRRNTWHHALIALERDLAFSGRGSSGTRTEL